MKPNRQDEAKMYQVSTLQALALGYSRKVVEVKELMQHGDIGLLDIAGMNAKQILSDAIRNAGKGNAV